jgi:Fe-S cluster biogenesis protein NfuA
VVQVVPDAPKITSAAVETVLDGVRPFLSIAGGRIDVHDITGVGVSE